MGIGNLDGELPDAYQFSKADAIFPLPLNGAIVDTIDVESDRVGALQSEDEDLLRGAAVALQPLWGGSVCSMTTVGGLRERLVATRRGRGKTVGARGAKLALRGGPQLCR